MQAEEMGLHDDLDYDDDTALDWPKLWTTWNWLILTMNAALLHQKAS
jgi:hypothetical protein